MTDNVRMNRSHNWDRPQDMRWTVDVQPPGDVNNQVILRAMFVRVDVASEYANRVNDQGLGYRVTMRRTRATDRPFDLTKGQ